MDEGSWSIEAHGAISDLQVSTMASDIVGSDMTSLSIFSFGVLAASSLMDGEKRPDAPLLSLDAPSTEIARHLDDYCRKIDRIWNHFGGIASDNLPALAIWMIRNDLYFRQEGNGAVPVICAAYLYGERQLSLRLLAEWEMHWRERMRSEHGQVTEEDGILWMHPTRESIEEVGTAALADLAKLRRIIDRRYMH